MTDAMTEPLPSSASSVVVSHPVGQPGRRQNVVSIAPFLDKSRFQKADDEGLYEPVYLEQAFQASEPIRFWRAELSADLFGWFIVEILSGPKSGRARVAIRSYASFDRAAFEVGRLCHAAMARGFSPLP
jgi:hypothetical protein